MTNKYVLFVKVVFCALMVTPLLWGKIGPAMVNNALLK